MTATMRPSPRRRLARALARVVEIALLLIIAIWLLGHVVSDRFVWSQYLSWIPALVTVGALVLLATLVALRRRRRTFGYAAALVVTFVWFGVAHHRFLRGDPGAVSAADVMHIVHWNADAARGDLDAKIQTIVDVDADLAIFTDPGWAPYRAADRMDQRPNLAALGPFVVMSRAPIRRFRWLGAADDVFAAVLEINLHDDPDAAPFVALVLDLPSEPHVSRADAVERARAFMALHDGPPPHLIAGDLNLERGAWSQRRLAPGHRHAYDVAGHGWGASFPRSSPFWHIDHLLVPSSIDVVRYDLIDPGAGRHLVQSMWIVSPPPSSLLPPPEPAPTP